jgi:hypothetical protein
MAKKCVKKVKCFVVSNLVIQKFDLSVQSFVLSILQSTLLILQIEALSNFLLYIEFFC